VCFRYDLTLKAADAGARCSASTTWTDWRSIAAVDAPGSSSREGLAALRAKLVALPLLQPGLAVRGIPNARLVGLARALERLRDSPTHASTLRELRSDGDASDGVEPQDLFDLAEELGFRLELGASRLAHECDALFDREGAELVETVFGAGERRPLDECATEPTNRGRARFGKRLAGDLAEESPRLAARSVVIVVDRISRHADGSLDRGALADEI
jgi:hypothetical protein